MWLAPITQTCRKLSKIAFNRDLFGTFLITLELLCREDAIHCATWGVFPNKEVMQPTIVDTQSFKVWQECLMGTIFTVVASSASVRLLTSDLSGGYRFGHARLLHSGRPLGARFMTLALTALNS